MRALFLAFGLALVCCGGAFADAASDCGQDKDLDLQIRGCSRYLEGGGKEVDRAIAYNNRGNANYSKRDYDRAIADYDHAIRLDPKLVFAYVGRGEAYDSKGDYDRAIADYDQAIRLNPEFAVAYHNRGFAYKNKGDYNRAIADCDQAIRLDPKLVFAYVGRGEAYDSKGDYDRAIADYDQAIRVNPEYALAYNDRGFSYKNKGDYDRAIADYDQAIRLDPKLANAHAHRGWANYKKGDIGRATADVNEAVRLNPKYASARERRGYIFLASGDAKSALEDFNEALRLKAESIGALSGRGQVYEQQGLRSLALADYKKAIELKAVGADEIDAQNKARARVIVLEAPAAPGPGSSVEQKPKPPMGRRVALVIGNGAYKAVGELGNPKNDAAAVAGELTRLGFEVIEKHDLGVVAMRKALGEFEDKATGAEWAFVYYAGHGMELNGRNWLIPVDAELVRATDTPDEAIPLERVLDRLAAASKLRIVVLDACRNNPFISRMVMNRVSTRAVARGLTAVEPSHGEVVFYAARDGSVASDGTGGNSPFATALVKHMDEDGVELGRFFRRVTSTVLAATGNQQEPFVYGRIPDEDFYFKPPR
jgi:tetratricopeptide (TPR) repeat protein